MSRNRRKVNEKAIKDSKNANICGGCIYFLRVFDIMYMIVQFKQLIA